MPSVMWAFYHKQFLDNAPFVFDDLRQRVQLGPGEDAHHPALERPGINLQRHLARILGERRSQQLDPLVEHKRRVVEEAHSSLSRQMAEALQPPEFQPPAPLAYDQLDKVMDSGKYTFVINVPANFQADLLAGRQPGVQVNVDATAMSQAFMGAGYIGRIFQRELLTYSGQADVASQAPALLTTRALFNTNLEGGWFLAVIQIVNNITILAIILTGTALLREREHGTLDHLLVLPLTALEIMLAKIWSNMLVVVLCTWLSLEVVVKGLLGVPLAGS